MAIYAIGDTHLSFGTDKPMDVFGGLWTGYTEKLKKNLSRLNADDTLVIAGDFSWGMSLEEALPDFRFMKEYCEAKLVMLKGNHDYWWNTVHKMQSFLEMNHIDNVEFLFNNTIIRENVALCGTRGWFIDDEKPGDPQNTKVFLRELGRLEKSLMDGKASNASDVIAFLHYPPIFANFRCQRIIDILKKYQIEECYYAHLHGYSIGKAFSGLDNDINFQLISADSVDFNPIKIRNNCNF